MSYTIIRVLIVAITASALMGCLGSTDYTAEHNFAVGETRHGTIHDGDTRYSLTWDGEHFTVRAAREFTRIGTTKEWIGTDNNVDILTFQNGRLDKHLRGMDMRTRKLMREWMDGVNAREA